MSSLTRSPKERGSWYWDLDEFDTPGLESALSLAARMTDVLTRYELLVPNQLQYVWSVMGAGTTGIQTTIDLTNVPLGDPLLSDRVRGSRPSSYPAAHISDVEVLGAGTWFDEQGQRRTEFRLLDLSISTAPTGLSAELSTHYDIWGLYDYSGRPHPQVRENNAPRLVDALKDLSSLLGVSPEPGEPTYFGAATVDGVADPDADENGMGPDLTDWLH
ncbi:hypothetical protein [Streptomyces sp. NPDC046939]|uniref:hypothetical protein n=1 Tax=Streptomyces sp. NPDC046939 TaxID=3155376 RepID=UPI0033FD0D7C